MPSSKKAQTMERITVIMQPLPPETRLLVMAGRHKLMRAILDPAMVSHRAAATPWAGLSLWHQQVLSVVLYADDRASSFATRMFDALGFGVKTVHYHVELGFPGHPRRGGRIHGFGKFGDLRRLCLQGGTI